MSVSESESFSITSTEREREGEWECERVSIKQRQQQQRACCPSFHKLSLTYSTQQSCLMRRRQRRQSSVAVVVVVVDVCVSKRVGRACGGKRVRNVVIGKLFELPCQAAPYLLGALFSSLSLPHALSRWVRLAWPCDVGSDASVNLPSTFALVCNMCLCVCIYMLLDTHTHTRVDYL